MTLTPGTRLGSYQVTAQSKDRFLLKGPLGEEDEGSVAVIANWTATLKQTR